MALFGGIKSDPTLPTTNCWGLRGGCRGRLRGRGCGGVGYPRGGTGRRSRVGRSLPAGNRAGEHEVVEVDVHLVLRAEGEEDLVRGQGEGQRHLRPRALREVSVQVGPGEDRAPVAVGNPDAVIAPILARVGVPLVPEGQLSLILKKRPLTCKMFQVKCN